MPYHVNETFLTLQGEGYWTGRPAVFCRFSRCNLWNGKEEDRHRAICSFCDTDFTEYTDYNQFNLVNLIDKLWQGDEGLKFVVLTGGEPLLQADYSLLATLKRAGFYVAVETNGTRELPASPAGAASLIDWVCVSPKTPRIRIRQGNELKLVYPQERIEPGMFAHLDFGHFWLSPMDGPDLQENTAKAIEYCLNHPQWRLNVQTHKYVGIR